MIGTEENSPSEMQEVRIEEGFAPCECMKQIVCVEVTFSNRRVASMKNFEKWW